MKQPVVWAGLLICALALVIFRILPHTANFSPVVALILISGFLGRKNPILLLIPALALVVGDLYLGLYAGWLLNFATMLTLLFIPTLFKTKASHFLAAGFCGATVFFLLSNFGVWMQGQLYPMTSEGLIHCYQMALPFYRATLMSTLSYMALFYVGLWFVQSFAGEAELEKL